MRVCDTAWLCHNSTMHVLDRIEPVQRACVQCLVPCADDGSWTAKAASLTVLLRLLLTSCELVLRRVSYDIERTGAIITILGKSANNCNLTSLFDCLSAMSYLSHFETLERFLVSCPASYRLTCCSWWSSAPSAPSPFPCPATCTACPATCTACLWMRLDGGS